MSSKINFPVIRRLEIQGYLMFPGEDNSGGLTQDFEPGVTVAVGINGLGKTTLLNVVLRLLVGPYNPEKADLLRPGSGRHTLVRDKRFNYFGERVPDYAEEAWAEGTFSFGKQTLTVRRTLSDLSILTLTTKAGQSHDATEETYQTLACELSGVSSNYDFHFLIRHLLFFTEERSPLIWYDQGQFEVLRILFFDRESSQRCAELSDKANVADSQFRNQLWHYNSERKKLENELSKVSDQTSVERDYTSLNEMLSGLIEKEEDLERRSTELSKAVEKIERELFRLDMDIEELKQEIRYSEIRFFTQLFPHAPDSLELVMAHYLTSDGCLICGSRGSDIGEVALAKVRDAICPVCDSHQEHQEKKQIQPISKRQIEDLNAKFWKKAKARESKSTELAELIELLQSNSNELGSVRRDRLVTERDLRVLQPQLPLKDSELREREERLDELLKEVDRLRKYSRTVAKKYREVTSAASEQIEKVAAQIQKAFSEYANQFLAEECNLQYELTEQKIGQGGATVALPSFTLHMTSGTMASPTQRDVPEQVSESQKEFIDLAFRMALMKAASPRTGRMLVIETPESSLDSVFITRAGSMLREFVESETESKRSVLFATCNLNGEHMIQELLSGLKGKRSKRKHIINLLKVAAPSKAYLDFKRAYDKEFEDIFG